MQILKAQEMQAVDQRAIAGIGIPSLVLMERAALGVVTAIGREFGRGQRVLVVAGKGNNGGDGLAIVRQLYLLGYQVDYVLPLGEDLKGDAQIQYQILRNLGLFPLTSVDTKGYDLLVDALFGTGFTPPPRGAGQAWIERMQGAGIPIVSVDIPSGLVADSGREVVPAVSARVTVTLQFPKLCHLLHPAAKQCGKLYVADIGIPPALAKDIQRQVLLSVNLPPRAVDVHKGKMGHVLLVGGSVGKTGAVMMAAKASTRAGAGLVTVGVPRGLNQIVETVLLEEMSVPLAGEERLAAEASGEILARQDKFTAVAAGMGMDRYPEGQRIVEELMRQIAVPLVLDADALNNLADAGVDLLRERPGVTVLTPHVGECHRLTGLPPGEINENLTDVAQQFAQQWGCYIVLKSSRTAIATPQGQVYLSTRGTAAMAKGGMGDVLAGILAALLGKGLAPLEALQIGVFVHGLAGEIAAAEKHTESLRPLDVIETLPQAFQRMATGEFTPPFIYL
ncbi:MAG: NAD(P)H-hydrate dehydratase [Pseudanabaenaceae cyanobacterium]